MLSSARRPGVAAAAVLGAPPRVRVYLPVEALQSFVTFYYFVESDGALTDFLYPEWGNVRFGVHGEWTVLMTDRYPPEPQYAALYGATDRRGEIVTNGGKTVGFGLTPLGWDRLIGTDAGAMANRVCDIGNTLGVDAESVRLALAADTEDGPGIARFEALLMARLAATRDNDPLVVAADRVLRTRPADVPAFASAAGMSPRTLHRVCIRAFGFPPKRLLRRQRFLDTLGQIRITAEGTVGALVDDEYCDQAHFNRDFREFMGMSPSAYLAAPRRLMREAAAAQLNMGIPLSFKLPPQAGGAPPEFSQAA